MKRAGGAKVAGRAAEKRSISQEAFDELVKENMDELMMDPAEALKDAIETLSLQGVDLSGIVKVVPGEEVAEDDPAAKVIRSLEAYSDGELCSGDADDLFREVLNYLASFPGAPSVLVKNGGIDKIWSICLNLPAISQWEVLGSGLRILSLLIFDLEGTEKFRKLDGPANLVRLLLEGVHHEELLDGAFALVAASAMGNEVVKEKFIELNIGNLILTVLNERESDRIVAVYDAIRVLLTPDDNRVVASQVYGYARKFAEIGIAVALVRSLKPKRSSCGLSSAIIALKAVAVNDEICKSIAGDGGVDVIFGCIDESGEEGNNLVAKNCCSLLTKLAGSDSIKTALIDKGRLNRLIQSASRFMDDHHVVSEVMSVMAVVCLRSPENASRVMEAGAGDLAVEAMERFPAVAQLQRSSCLMIRNVVARNAENRKLMLSHGVERLVRTAKEAHPSCREAANDALRDLGLDYNR